MSERRFKLKPFVNLDGDAGDPEGVLVDTHSATMCSCNGTAWAVLQALKSGASMSELAANLAAEFDVTEAEAREDAKNFVYRLVAMGLVDESA